MIQLLAVKTRDGYYKEGDPFLMVDLPRASVYPSEKADYVHTIITGLKQQGLDCFLVEMHINIKEWEDVPAWKSGQP